MHTIDDVLKNIKNTDENSFSIDFNTGAKSTVVGGDSTTVNSNNKYIVVLDADEVLVNITDKWFNAIKNHEVLKHYVTAEHQAVVDKFGTVLARNEYYFDRWLNITNKLHIQLLNDLYFNDGNFYDDLPQTSFAKSFLSSVPFIEEIHVVTACGTDINSPANFSKRKWLAKYLLEIKKQFPDIVVSIHCLTSPSNKGEYLNSKGIKYNTLVDDSPYNMEEIIRSNKSGIRWELMFPLYGFNGHVAMNPELKSPTKMLLTPFLNLENVDSSEFSKHCEEEARKKI